MLAPYQRHCAHTPPASLPPRLPARPQYDNGAQVVQIFDSWAAQLSPQDFDVFCAPYIKHIIAEAKKQCPGLPIILYISNSGSLVERMAACQPGARAAGTPGPPAAAPLAALPSLRAPLRGL